MAATPPAGHDLHVDDLRIEIIGEGATPETVPAHLLANLVGAYLTALYKVASEFDISIPVLCGGAVVEGSLAYELAQDAPRLKDATVALRDVLASNDNRAHVKSVRDSARAVAKYNPNWEAAVVVCKGATMTIPSDIPDQGGHVEETEVRARIVGSRIAPTPWLMVQDEDFNAYFKLDCAPEIAAEHCHNHGRLADIAVELVRDDEMRPKGGRATGVKIVDENWTVEGLLAWFSDEFELPQ